MSEAGQILDQAQATSQPLAGANKDVQPPAAQSETKEDGISSKLSVLMERERQALNRERMAKAQEEKLKDQLKRIQEFESVKTDPKKALDALGLSYDQLTQSILKDGEIPPAVEIQRLRDELEQYKSQQKQKEDTQAEEQKKRMQEQEQKAVTDFKSEITQFLKDNSARYELIDFEGAHDLVFDVIDEHYTRTMDPESGIGKVMSIAEASDKVEEHLEKKYLAAKEKNKVKAFWANMPKGLQEHLTESAVGEVRKPSGTSQPPRTLTNNLGPKAQTKPNRPPENERIKQILANFQAQRGA